MARVSLILRLPFATSARRSRLVFLRDVVPNVRLIAGLVAAKTRATVMTHLTVLVSRRRRAAARHHEPDPAGE